MARLLPVRTCNLWKTKYIGTYNNYVHSHFEWLLRQEARRSQPVVWGMVGEIGQGRFPLPLPKSSALALTTGLLYAWAQLYWI